MIAADDPVVILMLQNPAAHVVPMQAMTQSLSQGKKDDLLDGLDPKSWMCQHLLQCLGSVCPSV